MAIVQIPYLSLYSTSCIKLINHLVWGIYRDLSIQDGKNLSVSCRNFGLLVKIVHKIGAVSVHSLYDGGHRFVYTRSNNA